MDNFRIGFGYDVHPLVPERDLILGGIRIAYPKGASGHSDADVLLHALADALLGAAALGDIGTWFPDTDPKYKNADSAKIIKETFRMIGEKGYKVNNVDTTVVLQDPKLAPYIPQIRQKIALLLEVEQNAVSVKATTTEHMGFVGRGEGVAAYAVVSLVSR